MQKNNLLQELEEILEVLPVEAVEDVLTLGRLKVAVQDDDNIYISAEDWSKTPDEIKKAVSKILTMRTE